MKIAFIHNEKRIGTGAHYINDLMATKLNDSGVAVRNFYPRQSLIDTPVHLNGLKNILFFYSLLEHRKKILKFDVIQGTTYTPLPFLAYSIPVVSHFGSTTRGFLKATPRAINLENGNKKLWYGLRRKGVINEVNIKTRRPMRDIAEIEEYVALKADAVIATSEIVRHELLSIGVKSEKVHLIHNAIEDYWFESVSDKCIEKPQIVFLGRMGNDAFNLKLKGIDRLICLYKKFPDAQKSTFCITTNTKLLSWLATEIPHNTVYSNTKKDVLPSLLKPLRGSVLFIPSRYEGFSLSLIEGMSQGLIPVVYAVGVAPEIIRNGENGFLVSSQNEAVECVNKIINDEILRKKMSEQAIMTSHSFSGDIITKKLTSLYKSIKSIKK